MGFKSFYSEALSTWSASSEVDGPSQKGDFFILNKWTRNVSWVGFLSRTSFPIDSKRPQKISGLLKLEGMRQRPNCYGLGNPSAMHPLQPFLSSPTNSHCHSWLSLPQTPYLVSRHSLWFSYSRNPTSYLSNSTNPASFISLVATSTHQLPTFALIHHHRQKE